MGRFRLNPILFALLGAGYVLGGCGRVGYEIVDFGSDSGVGGQSGTAGTGGGASIMGGNAGATGVDAGTGGVIGTGGMTQDAAVTGGTAAGGTATGGMAAGGMGGTAAGGTTAGGTATGGAALGGTPAGGTAAGGTAAGGTATGGTAGTDAPPATPTGLVATADTPNAVDLSWTANAETDFSHYILYRSTTPGFLIAQGTVVSANIKKETLVDGGRPNCTTIYYRLVAVDNAGNRSAATAIAQATTLGPELVANGSFEMGGSGWPTGWVDPMSQGGRTTAVASVGNASLNVKGVDIAATTRPTVAVALVPLRRYRFSGQARVLVDLNGLGLQGGYYHLVNNFPVALVFSSFLRKGSPDWDSFTDDFTVPANYTSGYVQLYWGLVQADDEGWFDNVSLREICQ
jgi:hypothetical protein